MEMTNPKNVALKQNYKYSYFECGKCMVEVETRSQAVAVVMMVVVVGKLWRA